MLLVVTLHVNFFAWAVPATASNISLMLLRIAPAAHIAKFSTLHRYLWFALSANKCAGGRAGGWWWWRRQCVGAWARGVVGTSVNHPGDNLGVISLSKPILRISSLLWLVSTQIAVATRTVFFPMDVVFQQIRGCYGFHLPTSTGHNFESLATAHGLELQNLLRAYHVGNGNLLQVTQGSSKLVYP